MFLQTWLHAQGKYMHPPQKSVTSVFIPVCYMQRTLTPHRASVDPQMGQGRYIFITWSWKDFEEYFFSPLNMVFMYMFKKMHTTQRWLIYYPYRSRNRNSCKEVTFALLTFFFFFTFFQAHLMDNINLLYSQKAVFKKTNKNIKYISSTAHSSHSTNVWLCVLQ